MQPIRRSSEYAIRALTYLAQHGGEGYCLAQDIAAEIGIPAPFLGKVLQPLVTRGILQSQRGRNGGFRLAVPAAGVTLHQIVDSQEGRWGARLCFLGQTDCSDERACPLHEFWKEASLALTARLAKTSLADVVRFCEEHPESAYPFPSLARGVEDSPKRPSSRRGPKRSR